MRQAVLQLQYLNKSILPHKWAKNPAFDGRKESRLELKAHEKEQTARLQDFAASQEYPFEVSIQFDLRQLFKECLQPVVFLHLAG